MERERPPDLDAEFKVVHGAWPRWVVQLSLIKLALWTGAIVMIFCLIGLAIVLAVNAAGRTG
ncbi:MAG: hypothetical protein JSS35_19460 [Proteobacteria bacterium]|nr:hypothetical protein [Pseudomonadota bacterium]